MTLRTLRALLVLDIVSLVAVAAIHAGIVGGGAYQSASLYETAVAAVLAIGLGLTYAGPTVARWGAFLAQFLALAGVFTGLYMASRGMAPNTSADLAYHVLAIGLLVAGLVVALLIRPAEVGDERRAAIRRV